MMSVRRLLALVLLLVFGSAEAAPLLASAAAPASRLPICCRQGGMHHCMAMAMAADGQTAVRAACPLLPQWLSPLPNQTACNPVRPLLRAADAVWPGAPWRSADQPRSRWIEARGSRGPPAA